MYDAFFNTFMNATYQRLHRPSGSPSHWRRGERFDNRENAELEAHRLGRRT
ncbi:MAG: hypothetical protein AAF641_08880 [Pseudomonadota bacterium]